MYLLCFLGGEAPKKHNQKVSIITVTYNAEDTVENSIKTVISQTYPDVEYVIIDGGSNDRTVSIIEKYKDKVAYFVSEADNGIYNAMNKGIKASIGEILYFLNANDYLFDENVVKDVVEAFKKTKADIIFGDMSFIKENGEEKERRSFAVADKLFLTSENLCHQGIFYKKRVFETCALYNKFYDENYRLLADYDLNLKAIFKKKHKARHINRVIAKFTLEGQSNSPKYKELSLKEYKEIQDKFFKPIDFKMNKILNKTFRSIARNPKLRKIAGKIFGFALP